MLLLFALVLLKLLVREVLLVLQSFPLVPSRLVLGIFHDVFDLFAGKANGGARDVERQEEVERHTALPPGV